MSTRIPEVWTDDLAGEIRTACETIVTHEDAFIDLAFELGEVEGLSADEVKAYIRYIADRRLAQLGLQPIYQIEHNPLPWLDAMLNARRAHQFLRKPRDRILQGATQGTWEEAFG